MRVSHTKALNRYEKAMIARNLFAATRETNLCTASLFLCHVGKRLAKINREDVFRYRALRAKILAPTSAASELQRLRDFFETFVPKTFPENPLAGMRFGRPAPKYPYVVLSINAVKQLLAEASRVSTDHGHVIREETALRNRACLELLYGLGLRASEACAARVVDLNREEGTFLVRRAKNGVSRFLPVPKSTLVHLDRYLREGRPAFAERAAVDSGHFFLNYCGWPLSPGMLGQLINKLAKRLHSRAHPHAFRRTLATHLVREGVDLLALKELLGHKKLSTTECYVEVDRDDLAKAVSWLERPPRI